MILEVRVKPGKKEQKVVEISETSLEVHLENRPENGKANKELMGILSEKFPTAKNITIVRGKKSRNKTISIKF